MTLPIYKDGPGQCCCCECPDYVIAVFGPGKDLNIGGPGCKTCASVECPPGTLVTSVQVRNTNCSRLPAEGGGGAIWYGAETIAGGCTEWDFSSFSGGVAGLPGFSAHIRCQQGQWVLTCVQDGDVLAVVTLPTNSNSIPEAFSGTSVGGAWGTFQVTLTFINAPTLPQYSGCVWGEYQLNKLTSDKFACAQTAWPSLVLDGAACSYGIFNAPYCGATDWPLETASDGSETCQSAAAIILQWFQTGGDGTMLYRLSVIWTDSKYVQIVGRHKIDPPTDNCCGPYLRPFECADPPDTGSILEVNTAGGPPCDFKLLETQPNYLALLPSFPYPWSSAHCPPTPCFAPPAAPAALNLTLVFTAPHDFLNATVAAAWDSGGYYATYTATGDYFIDLSCDVAVSVSIQCSQGYWHIIATAVPVTESSQGTSTYEAFIKASDSQGLNPHVPTGVVPMFADDRDGTNRPVDEGACFAVLETIEFL